MNNTIFNKVYMWLAIGLLISFITGYYLSNNTDMLIFFIMDIGIIPLGIISLALTFVFKLFLNKLSVDVLRVLYIAYSMILGITIGCVFLVYELSSIISIFLITSLIFVALATYGLVTKQDLTKLGKILMIALLVIIITSLINYFIIKSEMIIVVISAISALVFTLFIAYDVQKIKQLQGHMEDNKLAIYGAFELYLDFINLFLDLIRLFGKRK